MPNPGQPTIHPGATGDVVRRAQRGLRRTPNLGLVVDGIFGPATEAAVKEFQDGEGRVVDGVVGPATWQALPDGGPMPLLKEGSSGAVVKGLQIVLHNGAGQWGTGPGAIDGDFGPQTKASGRRSSIGAAWPPTGSSAIARGRSRCTRRAPRSRRRSGCST